jgi:hypothetical protein
MSGPVTRSADDGGEDVKADANKISEAIWAYLHGELDEAGRHALEQGLSTDAGLRAQLERARRLDLLVREALPRLVGADGQADADAALAEEALAAWEREQPAAATPVPNPAPARWPRAYRFSQFRRPALGIAGLAAAALLILAVSPAWMAPRGLRWETPTFVPLAYRGAVEPAGAPALDPGAAQRCQQALVAALARATASRGQTLPSGLALSLRLQELRNGAFSVCVQARLRSGRAVGEWSGDFSCMEAFTGQVDSSAAAMAEELDMLSGAEGVGGRP